MYIPCLINVAFCNVDGEYRPFWERVDEQARESWSMKEVFNMDSSVRVEAIENLGMFFNTSVWSVCWENIFLTSTMAQFLWFFLRAHIFQYCAKWFFSIILVGKISLNNRSHIMVIVHLHVHIRQKGESSCASGSLTTT